MEFRFISADLIHSVEWPDSPPVTSLGTKSRSPIHFSKREPWPEASTTRAPQIKTHTERKEGEGTEAHKVGVFGASCQYLPLPRCRHLLAVLVVLPFTGNYHTLTWPEKYYLFASWQLQHTLQLNHYLKHTYLIASTCSLISKHLSYTHCGASLCT